MKISEIMHKLRNHPDPFPPRIDDVTVNRLLEQGGPDMLARPGDVFADPTGPGVAENKRPPERQLSRDNRPMAPVSFQYLLNKTMY